MGKMIIVKGATYTPPGQGSGSSTGGGSAMRVQFQRIAPGSSTTNWQLSATGELMVNVENAFWCSEPVEIPANATKIKGKGSCFMVGGIGGTDNTAAMAFYDASDNVLLVVNRVNTIVGTYGGSRNYFEWGLMEVSIPEGAKTLRAAFTTLTTLVPEEYCSGEGFVFV